MNRIARPARWAEPVIYLHWLSAAAMLALIAIGWAMIYGGFDAAATFDLFQWHKSLGFLALALIAARLAGRALWTAPPARTLSAMEQTLAAFTQVALYVLTLAAVVAGWVVVSASPLPIPSRVFGLFVVPDIAAPDADLFAKAQRAHRILAWIVAALIALHFAGAIKHHFRDRDDVLTRMLPRWPRRPRRRSSPVSS